MNIKILFVALLSFGMGSTATWFATINYASSNSSATSVTNATPSAKAIATAISNNPSLCPKLKDTLAQPTDEEATIAFRKRPNVFGVSAKTETKDIVKLGSCFKGPLTEIQCGADIDFGGNGELQQRQIGFSKAPSGWIARLL